MEKQPVAQKRQISPMEWTEKHDILFCREILVVEPFQYRKGSTERGKAWSDIAETLNSLVDGVRFKVNQRSVRERLTLLQTKFKQKIREEEKASGIAPDPVSELDVLLEEIIDKEKVAEELSNTAESACKKKMEKDKQDGTEARKKAMERYGETKKRKEEEGESSEAKPKRKRRSGNETIEYLKEKAERDHKLRELELEMQKKDQEECTKRLENESKRQQEMLRVLQENSEKMQTAMMQQQQQQNKLLLDFMERFISKPN